MTGQDFTQADVDLIEAAWDEHKTAYWDGLIAECQCGSREDNHDEKVLLAALVSAHRLLPSGATISEQWSVRKSSVVHGEGYGLPTNSRDKAAHDRDRWLALSHGHPVAAVLVRREVRHWPGGAVFVGAWTPVEETP